MGHQPFSAQITYHTETHTLRTLHEHKGGVGDVGECVAVP